MNRQQRRAREKMMKKASQEEKALAEKISLFDHLPEACSACTEPFDRKNRQMAMEWTVTVREEEQAVRLFCPQCINKTKEVLENDR